MLLGPGYLQALVAAEAELAEAQQALDAPLPAEELHRAMEVAQVREGSARCMQVEPAAHSSCSC